MRVLLPLATLTLALVASLRSPAVAQLANGESRATWRTLLDQCVDGVMTARPTAFEKLLRSHDIPEACA